MDEAAQKKAALLIAEIREAFGSASRGNGITLHEADAMDDYATDEQLKTARELDTDTHWWEIQPEKLERLHSALYYLDAEGFRYYLPAYMTQTIKTCTTNSLTMDVALNSLYPLSENAIKQYALLDNLQRRTIAKFLWFFATETNRWWDNELDIYNATKALETYWYPYLS